MVDERPDANAAEPTPIVYKESNEQKKTPFCGLQPRSDEYLWRAEMEIHFLLIGLGK